jgi:hypothetical protein
MRIRRREQTRPEARRRTGATARIAVIGVSLSLGLLLIVLAAPRLYAELVMLPGNAMLDAIDHGQTITTADLRILQRSRERAPGWTDSGRARLELAAADILLAQREVGGGARYHELMDAALQALGDSLSRAPADPYAWTRLAYARLADGETAERVVPILAMAIEAAPVEATLVFPRLELCLIEWPYFAEANPALFQDQVRLAWDQSRFRLVRLALSTGRRDAVRGALAEADRAAFDKVASGTD